MILIEKRDATGHFSSLEKRKIGQYCDIGLLHWIKYQIGWRLVAVQITGAKVRYFFVKSRQSETGLKSTKTILEEAKELKRLPT